MYRITGSGLVCFYDHKFENNDHSTQIRKLYQLGLYLKLVLFFHYHRMGKLLTHFISSVTHTGLTLFL